MIATRQPAQSSGSAWILGLVCAAQLLLQLDFSIVNVALSVLQHDLGFTAVSLQWVVTGYALAYGSLLLLAGRVGDVLGHRRAMLIGLAVFAVASLTGGLAVSPAMLVVSRFVQGCGAALVAPSALAILTAAYPSTQARTRALGVFQASVAGGATAGIVLGGVLVEFFGWRSVLLVNPPIIAALLPLMLRRLPARSPAAAGTRLDVAGATLITAALVALVLATSSGERYGFASAWVLAAVGASAVLMFGFVAVERRVRQPMLPPALLRDNARTGSLMIMVLMGAVVAAYVYFIALYLQQVLHLSALRTGLGLVPATVTVMVCSVVLSRRLLPRLGTRWMLVLALPVTAAGQLRLSRITADGSYLVDVLPGLLLTAAGMGLALPTVSVAVTAGVPSDLRGVAGGLLVTAQQAGGAVGLAVLAAAAATRAAPVDGFRTSFLIGAGVALCAAALALAFIRSDNQQRAQLTVRPHQD
ncbi:MFS transporter [Actinoplanes cyaneus]|uniref:MFS transporter n=1 Tax=Actinoplanes cyaneus TaxID=52696 RepID=UPI001941B47E|nr:MFS transporter [Actinoplanes cyaneus]